MRRLFTFNYHILRKLHTKIGRVKYANFEHPTSDSGTTNYTKFVRRSTVAHFARKVRATVTSREC